MVLNYKAIVFDVYFYVIFRLTSFLLMVIFYNYFLLLLIIMELVVINVSVYIYFNYGINMREVLFVYYLVFRVCERVVGLVILVVIIRYHGGDYCRSFRLVKF